jgi:ABC-2 type transport system permease protein
MTRQLRAELLKQRSTQTLLFLLLAMVGLVALVIAMHVLAPAASTLATHKDQLRVFEAGSRVGMIFAALAGAIAMTSELRYGTIRPTFLVVPRRTPVFAAKALISLVTGLVLGLLAEALMIGAAAAAFSSRGIDLRLDGGDIAQLLAGGAAAAAFWALIGLGVGAAVGNQVGTLVGLFAWGLLVENLLLGFVPSVGRFSPASAGLALTGKTADRLLAPAPGLVLLVLYAVGFAAAGWRATLRREIA